PQADSNGNIHLKTRSENGDKRRGDGNGNVSFRRDHEGRPVPTTCCGHVWEATTWVAGTRIERVVP
ncbi:MAG TPA: hypothetical protein VFQ54_09710, partial [Thermomicrobiales bacterium]|nr:hypothetical protein [Thermomicrobiales bacterium]